MSHIENRGYQEPVQDYLAQFTIPRKSPQSEILAQIYSPSLLVSRALFALRLHLLEDFERKRKPQLGIQQYSIFTVKFNRLLPFLVPLFGSYICYFIILLLFVRVCRNRSDDSANQPIRFGSLFLLLGLCFSFIYHATRFHRRFLFLYTW